MPYWEIVNEFIRRTGRRDLGTLGDEDTTLDSGPGGSARFFINAGQRFLDMQVETPRSRRAYRADITAGQFRLIIKDLRSIDWIAATNEEGNFPFEFMDFVDFRGKYTTRLADLDRGTPTHYTIGVPFPAPGQEDDFSFDGEDFFDDDCEDDSYELTESILLAPPADVTYTVAMFGRFWSKKLKRLCDQTYWTERHPEALILAAVREHTISLSNTQGQRDMEAALAPILSKIGNDMVRAALAPTGGIISLRG